ncbi:MAG: phosphatase PAP2 family protein [Burkholderiales bacterium]
MVQAPAEPTDRSAAAVAAIDAPVTPAAPSAWVPHALVQGALVLAALVLAALVLAGADERAVFRWFNHAPFLPGAVWQSLSVLGLGVSALICVMVLLQPHRPDLVAAMWLSFLTVGIPIHVAKRLVERPRPAAVLPPEMIEILGRPLTHGAFPSGHSGTAFAVLALVLLAAPRMPLWTRLVALVLALGVLWSRMACGAHWPWDVLGGATLGWLGGAAALWIAGRSGLARWCGSARAQPWLIAVLLVASVASAFDNTGYPDGVALQWALAVCGAAVALVRGVVWLRRRQGAPA